MNAAPLVSVIIPVWNGDAFLRDAVASVLAQAYSPLEILVIDDGSTDDTPRVAAELGDVVSYHAFPHRGLVATRAAGLNLARGDLIAFLDVDDLWDAHKTHLQLKLFKDNPDAQIVIGYMQMLRLVSAPSSPPEFEPLGAPLFTLTFGSALFRREVFSTVSYLPGLHEFAEDMDWLLRARELQVPMLIHPDVVHYYRRHAKNMSNDHEAVKRTLLQMLKSSLARRQDLGLGSASLAPLVVPSHKG